MDRSAKVPHVEPLREAAAGIRSLSHVVHVEFHRGHAQRRGGAAGDEERTVQDLAFAEAQRIDRWAGGDVGDGNVDRRAGLSGDAAELSEHGLGAATVAELEWRCVGERREEDAREGRVLAEPHRVGRAAGEAEVHVAAAGLGEVVRRADGRREQRLGRQEIRAHHGTLDRCVNVAGDGTAPPVLRGDEAGAAGGVGVGAVVFDDGVADVELRRVELARAEVIEGEQRIGSRQRCGAEQVESRARVVKRRERIHGRRAVAEGEVGVVLDKHVPQHRRTGAAAERDASPIACGRRETSLVVGGGEHDRVERGAVGIERTLLHGKPRTRRETHGAARGHGQHGVAHHGDVLQDVHGLAGAADNQADPNVAGQRVGPGSGRDVGIEGIVAVEPNDREVVNARAVEVVNLHRTHTRPERLPGRQAVDGGEVVRLVVKLEAGETEQIGRVVTVSRHVG